tara:strand:- start:2952 stop:3407 length:456 start_codon:yes stop_codon:yes gene_type:complete
MVSDYNSFVQQLADFADSDARFGGLLVGRGPSILESLKVSEDLPYIVLVCDEGKYKPNSNTWDFNVRLYTVANTAAKVRTGETTYVKAISELMPLCVAAFGALVNIPDSMPHSGANGVGFDTWDTMTKHNFTVVQMSDTFTIKDCTTQSWR